MPGVGEERISKVVGYIITKGDYSTVTPNLPQRIAILAEANDANQSTFPTAATNVTSAKQAADLYGPGSPVHQIMRILRPVNGGGVGGIQTVVYAQAAAVSAAAKTLTVTVTGTATDNCTHTLVIAGRKGLDGLFYDVNIKSGDTPTIVAGKIRDVINSVLGCPVIGTAALGVATAVTKWSGLTSNDLTITVDTGVNAGGLTYAVASTVTGAGTPSIAAALALFADEWNTVVINGYGAVSSIMTALEGFNGIPDPEAPTGRFTGTIMKPFIALTGSTLDNPSSITDTRKANVTIAICPAPNSKGWPFEAAANMAALFARKAQDTPELDVSGMTYPDMPTPSTIGTMSAYDDRDTIVKKGCSTTSLVAGLYKIMDFVSTYHPDGETPPQFRYPRNMVIDLNVYFGYYLLEQLHVVDHVIAADGDIVSATKVIKPKQWKQILFQYALDLANRGLIVDAEFMQKSITVRLSTSNPDRLETFFRYKRSGIARISSTTAEAGFNFGTLTN